MTFLVLSLMAVSNEFTDAVCLLPRRTHDRDERDIRLPPDASLTQLLHQLDYRLRVAAQQCYYGCWRAPPS